MYVFFSVLVLVIVLALLVTSFSNPTTPSRKVRFHRSV
jgi:hypothetical protein